mmetsp:Transcript_72857/g.144811  ORF Transcript_72857/g.144811 Transcript_72857/m.144811 type:complete len:225 (+) Transcript_72857:88-762(+)
MSTVYAQQHQHSSGSVAATRGGAWAGADAVAMNPTLAVGSCRVTLAGSCPLTREPVLRSQLASVGRLPRRTGISPPEKPARSMASIPAKRLSTFLSRSSSLSSTVCFHVSPSAPDTSSLMSSIISSSSCSCLIFIPSSVAASSIATRLLLRDFIFILSLCLFFTVRLLVATRSYPCTGSAEYKLTDAFRILAGRSFDGGSIRPLDFPPRNIRTLVPAGHGHMLA